MRYFQLLTEHFTSTGLPPSKYIDFNIIALKINIKKLLPHNQLCAHIGAHLQDTKRVNNKKESFMSQLNKLELQHLRHLIGARYHVSEDERLCAAGTDPQIRAYFEIRAVRKNQAAADVISGLRRKNTMMVKHGSGGGSPDKAMVNDALGAMKASRPPTPT